jgi:hypothetical protein
MLDENHMYMDESYKNMKYLDERGVWMIFWMIIGNRQMFVWKFRLIECMDEINSKKIMMIGNY